MTGLEDLLEIFKKVDNCSESLSNFTKFENLPKKEFEIEIHKNTSAKIEKDILQKNTEISDIDPRKKLDRLVSIEYPVDYGLIVERKIFKTGKKEYDDGILISIHDKKYTDNTTISCYVLGEIKLIDKNQQDNKAVLIPEEEIKYNLLFKNQPIFFDEILKINYAIKKYLIFCSIYKFTEKINFSDSFHGKIRLIDFCSNIC